MPLLVLSRVVSTAVSLTVLALSFYLLYSWLAGQPVATADGTIVREHESWRLVTGLVLLGWSFLGRHVVLPLIARPDGEGRFELSRGQVHQVEGEAGRLSVDLTGRPEHDVIVLTHGWGLDSRIWTRLRRRLAGAYHVVAWDLPGMGWSRRRRGADVGPDAFAADLARLLRHVGEGKVILVGHSIGGMTLQSFARNHPQIMAERVRGVILLNTTHTDPSRTMWASRLAQALRAPVIEPILKLTALLGPVAQFSAWQSYLSGSAHLANRIGFSSEVTRAELDRTTRLTTFNPQGVQAKGDLGMLRWDSGEGLRQLSQHGAPVLVIGGGKDVVTKVEASRTIAAAVRGAELRVVENANHMGFLEQHERYAEEIEAFARKAFAAPKVSDAPAAGADVQRQARPTESLRQIQRTPT
jgi:pimeloyl-ACP methyl ester carboxylesterase